MSFQFNRDESVARGVRRFVHGQIDDALDELHVPESVRDEAVHKVRKRLKKVRAVLRLARGGLGEKVYRRENAYFRNAGRPLTEVRDSLALVEVLDKLAARYGTRIPAEALVRVRSALETNHRIVRERVLDRDDALAVAEGRLRKARARVGDWEFRRKGWSALRDGLRRTYRRGCRDLAAVAAAPSADRFHELRKRAKCLCHQLEGLQLAWPDGATSLVRRLDQLAQHLGDHHDLINLRRSLDAGSDALAAGPRRTEFLTLIDRRRGDLELEALRLGRQVFADKPNAFTNRLAGFWRAWRAGEALPTESVPHPSVGQPRR